MPRPGWLRLLQRYGTRLFVLLALTSIGAGAAWWYQQDRVERAALVRALRAAKIQQDTGHYEEAWNLFEQARSLAPDNPEVHENEAQLAMAWLEQVRITVGKGSFSAIVDKVLPALSRCAVSPDKLPAADCLAHMGWGDFLKSREGQGGLRPEQFYQQALALDPENAYARAMWGFHIVESHGSPADAQEQFKRALASGKERLYVRQLQIAALLYSPDERFEEEVMRVVNDMSVNVQFLRAIVDLAEAFDDPAVHRHRDGERFEGRP